MKITSDAVVERSQVTTIAPQKGHQLMDCLVVHYFCSRPFFEEGIEI
jgi:hypothetical protein